MARQFFFKNAASPTGQGFVMTASGGIGQTGQGVTTTSRQDGTPLSEQLWQLTPEGMIALTANPQLTIGIDLSSSVDGQGYSVQTCRRDLSDTTQLWTLAPAVPGKGQQCQLVSQYDSSLYLCVQDTTPSDGTAVIVGPQQQQSNLYWYLDPALLETPFLVITSALSTEAQDLVVAVDGTVQNGALVVVDPAQPGALNQAWVYTSDGMLLSAANMQLALTVDSNKPDDAQVTLATSNPGSEYQTWTLDEDGMISATINGKTVVMNVDDSGTAPGTALLTYDVQDGPPANEMFRVSDYVPTANGQYFAIGNAWKPSGTEVPWLLTVFGDSGDVYAAAPLGDSIVPSGTPSMGQLWRMTFTGLVVSALNPSLALTASSDGSITVAPVQNAQQSDAAGAQNSASGQYWAWAYGGELAAPDNSAEQLTLGILQSVSFPGQVLAVQSQPGVIANPAVLVAQGDTPVDADSGQLWYVVPGAAAFDQYTMIRSGMDTDLIVSVPADATIGSVATLAGTDSRGANTTWQFTPAGQIVSSVNPLLALSLQAGDGSGGTQGVCLYPLQPGNPRFQLWTATLDGMLVNRHNGQALAVSGAGAAGDAVITTPVSGGAVPAAQRWHFSTGGALQTILAQPPVPWPMAQAGSPEADAYAAANAALGLGDGADGTQQNDLRSQYGNLAAPLAAYQAILNGMACPGGVASGAWDAVVQQLNKELTTVIAVQALFQQWMNVYLALYQAQAMVLPELVTAVELSDVSTVRVRDKDAWIWDAVEGLIYTGLNAAGLFVGDPEAGRQLSWGARFVKNGLPVVANLMQTGFTSYQAHLQARPQNISRDVNFEMTVLQMQQNLLASFQQAGMAYGEIECAILADWNKVQAVYKMITTTDGPDSLYFAASMSPALVNQLLPGYVISVLQILMPANSKISKISRCLEQTYSDKPVVGLQSDKTQYIAANPDGSYTTFSTTASADQMQLVWDNGGNAFQFFHAQAGWSQLSISESSDDGYDPCVACFCFIQNFTSEALVLRLFSNDDMYYVVQNGTQPLPPYGITNFGVVSAGEPGDPVHASFAICNSAGTALVNGNIHCEGTSHDWENSATIGDGVSGYVCTSKVSSVRTDVIIWNVDLFPAIPQ